MPFYVRRDATSPIMGPLTKEKVEQLIERGRFDGSSLVSGDGKEWHECSETNLFRHLFGLEDTDGYAGQLVEIEDAESYNAAPVPSLAESPAGPPQVAGVYLPHPSYAGPVSGGPAGQSYSGMSTAAFVLSLCGLLLFGPILGTLAVVFSAIALSGMSKSQNVEGKSMAIAALVIGIIDIVFGFFWGLFWFAFLFGL